MSGIVPYQPTTPSVNGSEEINVPVSVESERAVIGAILTNEFIFAPIASFLKAHQFYLVRHATIWQAFERIHARGDSIDYLTTMDELRNMGRLDDIGGPAYLMNVVNATPTSMHVETYARLVLRAWLRRAMLQASDIIRNLALGAAEIDVEEARAEMQRQAAEIMGVSLGGQERTLSEIAHERMDFIEQRMKNPNLLLGIPTGLRALDDILAGLQKTDLIILAGVPGMGKTSLLLTALLNAAKLGKRVGIVSQEMGESQIWDRLVALETGMNLQLIRTGNLTTPQFKLYAEATARLTKLPICIHDGSVSPAQLRATALNWTSKRGLDLLMLDYLQIMSGDGMFKSNQRAQEVGWFARTSKALAKELKIPLLAAAQLNREVQGRPELRNLRDSGEIEQEADVVMFIYRDEYYNANTETPGAADIIIAKQRNGPTGTVTTYFDKTNTRFENATGHRIDLSRKGYDAYSPD